MNSNTEEAKAEPYRCAVVTGANKGIGIATARLIAQQGIAVVLTARNEKRGVDAVESLRRDFGLSNVFFHQLDVWDPASAAGLARFIATRFGKLDILVNNAAAPGISLDEEGLRALKIPPEALLSGKAINLIREAMPHTYDGAVVCLDTNYFGCRRVFEALLPLLQLSDSGARIVNVSSRLSELKRIPSEEIKAELGNIENLDEDKIEKLLQRFLEDLKEGKLEAGGWSTNAPAYSISKACLNAYTRVLAKRHPKMYINCVHPGYVKTDMNWNTGILTTEEGAKGPVMLALVPDGGPSGCYFDQTNMAEF